MEKTDRPKLEKAVKKLVSNYFKMVEEHGKHGYLHKELIRRVERELIHQVMEHTEQNQSQSARVLGVSRTTLRKKLAEHGIS